MTLEYLEQLRSEMRAQVVVAMRGGLVPCHECCRAVPLWALFRCYYCGFWYCKRHAAEHFNLEAVPECQGN